MRGQAQAVEAYNHTARNGQRGCNSGGRPRRRSLPRTSRGKPAQRTYSVVFFSQKMTIKGFEVNCPRPPAVATWRSQPGPAECRRKSRSQFWRPVFTPANVAVRGPAKSNFPASQRSRFYVHKLLPVGDLKEMRMDHLERENFILPRSFSNVCVGAIVKNVDV